MNEKETRALLAKYGIHPSRALGQNFLCDGEASAAIASAACAHGLPVLEIGPGLGALTGELLKRAPRVTAVEIDAAMVAALGGEYGGSDRLTVIHGDFLKAYPGKADMGAAFSAAGNLPYYVTSDIALALVSHAPRPRKAVLMVQKEAAERFFAGCSNKLYGPLAVLSQYYYRPGRLMELPPEAFYPAPHVDSAVVELSARDDVAECPELPALLNTVFAMRRKTVFNNLSAALGRDKAAELLEKCGVEFSARAEALGVDILASMAFALGEMRR